MSAVYLAGGHLNIRVGVERLEQYRDAAADAGMPLAAWVREVLDDTIGLGESE